MFTKPIFETLPILVTALSLLLIAFIHHPVALIAGLGMIVASILIMYRYYTELGTNPDALDESYSIELC